MLLTGHCFSTFPADRERKRMCLETSWVRTGISNSNLRLLNFEFTFSVTFILKVCFLEILTKLLIFFILLFYKEFQNCNVHDIAKEPAECDLLVVRPYYTVNVPSKY